MMIVMVSPGLSLLAASDGRNDSRMTYASAMDTVRDYAEVQTS